MTEKILLLGSTGLVGSAIKRILKTDGILLTPTREELDLTDRQKTLNYFKVHQPTHVYHCAAKVAGLFGNTRRPASISQANILMNSHVLEAAATYGKPKVLAYLSSCIFPHEIEYPLKSERLHFGPPHESNFAYAHAKRMLAVQADAYRREFGLNVILGIPTNIFGPHDYFNLEDSHVVPGLIHKAFLARSKNEKLVVSGTGKPLREFVYSDDIARLSIWMMKDYDSAEPLFMTPGAEIPVGELVTKIAKRLHMEESVVFDTTKSDGQYRKPTDASRLKALNPSFEFTPVTEAIDKTVDWFLRSYPNVRV